MDMIVHARLSSSASKQVQERLACIAKLEQEKARLIARMNRPHLVAARWIRMRLIWLFN